MNTQASNHKCGVKTQTGKEISKYNAVRHGVFRQLLLPDEIGEAQTITDQFMSEYEPKSLTEELLIETMVTAYMRRQRATNAEREYIMEILNPAVYEERIITSPSPDASWVGDPMSGLKELKLIKPAHHARISSDKVSIIDRTYARYINTCERQFFRALHELQRIQSIRKGLKPTSMAVDFISERQSED